MLAAGLVNRFHSREVMKESIQDTGRQVVAELERYLNTLGTIAAVTPLLGLLGTVIGMIEVFGVIMEAGVGNPGVLAGGISQALITTAAGLSVAIPALMFHRYFNNRVDKLIIGMEEQALRLIEVMKGEREPRRGGCHEPAPAAPRAPDINLTPLIDVVFLLLIFFMVSTTFNDDARLRLQLPQADGEATRAEERNSWRW
jgi:hypothetical protein